MLDININDSRDLNFEIELSGIGVTQLEGRLRMVIDNIEYGIPAKIMEKSIDILIPPLKNLIQRELKEGEVFSAKLEVQGDGNYLNPWSGEFQIRNPVALEAKIVELEKDGDKPVISVSINESRTTKEVKTKITGKQKAQTKINEMKIKTSSGGVKKFKNKEDFKNKLTKEDVISWLRKKGTKNPQVQEIIYEQAVGQCGSGKPYKVMMELSKVVKK
jgi:hypothetical protein